MEKTITQALAAVRSLGAAPEERPPTPAADSLTGIPADLIHDMLGRVKQAAELGDVTEISTIAGELKSEAKPLAPICEKLERLADDFDLNGIQAWINELDG